MPHLAFMTYDDNALARTRTEDADEALVPLAIEDDRYFAILVERYAAKLRRYVMRFINCGPDDAEDIVQNTFINAYRNLNDFDTGLKFSSWIYRIAHNEAVSHVRRIAARAAMPWEDDKLEALASEVDVEEDLHKKMNGAAIRAAVDRLDAKYKEVLVLRYFEDKSYEEISDILRKPQGSVSSLITRAKRLLAAEIKKAAPQSP
jgi:RNA polymerase sigma-70 factor (ECF subfamily)